MNYVDQYQLALLNLRLKMKTCQECGHEFTPVRYYYSKCQDCQSLMPPYPSSSSSAPHVKDTVPKKPDIECREPYCTTMIVEKRNPDSYHHQLCTTCEGIHAGRRAAIYNRKLKVRRIREKLKNGTYEDVYPDFELEMEISRTTRSHYGEQCGYSACEEAMEEYEEEFTMYYPVIKVLKNRDLDDDGFISIRNKTFLEFYGIESGDGDGDSDDDGCEYCRDSDEIVSAKVVKKRKREIILDD